MYRDTCSKPLVVENKGLLPKNIMAEKNYQIGCLAKASIQVLLDKTPADQSVMNHKILKFPITSLYS